MKKGSRLGSQIYLIEPPSRFKLSNGGKVGIPLGIGYVAAYLRKNDIPFVLDDYNAVGYNLTFLRLRLAALKPSLIGISCNEWNVDIIPRMLEIIKTDFPGTVVALGGGLVRYDPLKYMQRYPSSDIIVRDEGEITFFELAKLTLSSGITTKGLFKIEGIVFRDNETPRQTKRREFINNIDSLPSPIAQQLFDLSSYTNTVTVLAARGCPFKCVFCQWGGTGVPYRKHSEEYIVNELLALKAQGVTSIAFGDGTINSSTERLRRLRALYKKNSLSFEIYDMDCRAEFFNEEQAEIFKDMGVVEVGFGLESVHRKTQLLIKKNIDPQKVAKAVALCKKFGFFCHVSMIIGLPGESRADVLKTINFVKDLGVTYAGVFAVRYEEGTALTQNADLRTLLTRKEIEELRDYARNSFRTLGVKAEEYGLRNNIYSFLSRREESL